MGKVKQWAMDNAEKNVDIVVNDYINNKINLETAKNKVLKVENVNMTGIDELNVDESLKIHGINKILVLKKNQILIFF